jgi:hypothetical protein
MTSCTIAARGRLELGRTLDRWSRVVFPTAFVAVMVWFWGGG